MLSEKHKEICQELNDEFNQKQALYGNSYIELLESFGELPAVLRLNEKNEKYKTAYKNGNTQVSDEPPRTTLLDLANYCIQTVIWLDENSEKEGK